MQLAVGGMRFNGGGWAKKDNQQKLFSDFGLDSYSRGELDFQLKRSVLIQPMESETEDILKKKADRAVSLENVVDRREQLSIAGYSDEQIDEILTRIEQEENRKKIEGGIPALSGGRPVPQLGNGLPVE
jgi:hypothetical protein